VPFRRHPLADPRVSSRFTGTPIDADLVARLRDSHEQLAAQGTAFSERFYRKLFEAAPGLRSMFKSDPNSQAEKLASMLGEIINNLEATGDNTRLLAELGRRHAGYGAKPKHYDLVTTLLVESIRETLALDAEATIIDEWRMMLRLISDQMIAASTSTSPTASDEDEPPDSRGLGQRQRPQSERGD
jgi:hemoglobin-like flavoprotein